ncbi:SigE family RNA polymerase sigma factor [Actinocorallia lasiicapitis]
MGDPDGYAGFVAARSDRLARTAYLLTRDWALAEDLLQEALAKAWTAWSRLDDQPEAYVRRIIVTTYLTWWRRRWRGERPTAFPPERPGPDELAAHDERDLVWRALGRLAPRQRAVIVLRFYEDLTEAQTARLLGVTVGTVKSQTAKALAALRVDATLRPSRNRIDLGVGE